MKRENKQPPKMSHTTLLLFLFLLSLLISPSLSYSKPEPKPDPKYESFIITACNTTTYPALCRKTCLTYASLIKANPQKLMITALNATLSAAQAAAAKVANLAKRKNRLGKYEAAAVRDCIENVSDCIDEVKRSIAQMEELAGTTWNNNNNNSDYIKFKISNIQTWMSAAITNEDTCMDGIGEDRVSPVVKGRIRGCVLGLAKLTSNALSLCNHLSNTN